MKLAVLNTSILTTEGTFTLKDITLEEARNLVKENEILSAVGHQSTADILTTLLETEVPMNRIQFAQEKGQKAYFLKAFGFQEEEMAIVSFGACNFHWPYCKRDCQYIDNKGNVIATRDVSMEELKQMIDTEVAKGRNYKTVFRK